MDYYVNDGSMVNLCLLDLSKAFDKMNRYALYIKLTNRSVPLCVLSVYSKIGIHCVYLVSSGVRLCLIFMS